jgi:hypothetical protein
MKTTTNTAAKWTKLNKTVRAARQAAADYAFNNKPLSPEMVSEHRALVATADAAQAACDAFYAANCKAAGGSLNC